MVSTKTQSASQRLIIDMISFTLHIDEGNRLLLIERINDPKFHEQYNRKVYNNTGGRYKNNYEFSINGITIKLSLYPINKSHNFLRGEYNPTKLKRQGRKELRILLIKLLGNNVVKTIFYIVHLIDCKM